MNCGCHPSKTGAYLVLASVFLLSPAGAEDMIIDEPISATSSAPVLPSVSPVIWAENPEVVQRFAVNPTAVRDMVDSCLLKLTSAHDLGTAWTRLGITPQDIVGIKITTSGGPLLSTHRPIVQAIIEGLQAAGVPLSSIIIWDKDADEMRRAGYAPVSGDDSHAYIAGVFPGTGYDPKSIYKNELIGTLIWGDYDFVRNESNSDLDAAASEAVKNKAFSDDPANALRDTTSLDSGTLAPQTSNNSYYARMVSQICTKIINVPALTDNSAIGIDGCLGSLALACVDNNRRFQGDPTYGDPAISEILEKDFIRRKVVVHILDALVAQYAGGPMANPQFTKSVGAIYVSRDPVAIDSLVLPRLEAWRASDRSGRIDPIGKTAAHVHGAALNNLGTDDPHRIQLIRL